MIRVQVKPEYPDFDAKVRRPGMAFLIACPKPSSKEFRRKNFWTRAAKELHAAYGGVCAYTAMYLTEQGSVDHFYPKATYPKLAYEWSNYRLASGRVNTAKNDQTNILDPFEVENDWFYLDLPSCMLKANPALDRVLRLQIENTITCLRLNSDDYYVQERCEILKDYASGEVALGFLMRRYPFLAKEIARQSLDQVALCTIFRLRRESEERGQPQLPLNPLV